MCSRSSSAVLLTSMVFSLGGFINALFAKNFDQISWFPTFVLTPLTYLGGVFYSVTMLPGWAHVVSHANPILYMVSAFRYGFLGTSDVDLRLAYGIMVGGRRRHVRAGRGAAEPRHRHSRLRESTIGRNESISASWRRAARHCRRRFAHRWCAQRRRRAVQASCEHRRQRRPPRCGERADMQGFSATRRRRARRSSNSASMPICRRRTCAPGCSRWPPSRITSARRTTRPTRNSNWRKFREWGWDASIETFSVLYPTPREVSVELRRRRRISRRA